MRLETGNFYGESVFMFSFVWNLHSCLGSQAGQV